MFIKYNEIMILKDLFTTKFDANKFYKAIVETQSGDLLYTVDIKQLDKLTPTQIITLMKDYKNNVLRVYNKKTSNKILQRILDYCYDYTTICQGETMTISVKELEWFFEIIKNNVCNIYDLWDKCKFTLSDAAKKELLTKYAVSVCRCFRKEFTDKQLSKYADSNVGLVSIMKKPSAQQMWNYYNKFGAWRMCENVEVNCYPNDLLVELINKNAISLEIIRRNDKDGLIKVLYNIEKMSHRVKQTIDETNNAELQNYGALVNYDSDLLKQYIYNKLGVEVNNA